MARDCRRIERRKDRDATRYVLRRHRLQKLRQNRWPFVFVTVIAAEQQDRGPVAGPETPEGHLDLVVRRSIHGMRNGDGSGREPDPFKVDRSDSTLEHPSFPSSGFGLTLPRRRK